MNPLIVAIGIAIVGVGCLTPNKKRANNAPEPHKSKSVPTKHAEKIPKPDNTDIDDDSGVVDSVSGIGIEETRQTSVDTPIEDDQPCDLG